MSKNGNLVLTRLIGEKIILSHRILGEIGSICVVDVRSSGSVRLGFKMPDDIIVLREEQEGQ